MHRAGQWACYSAYAGGEDISFSFLSAVDGRGTLSGVSTPQRTFGVRRYPVYVCTYLFACIYISRQPSEYIIYKYIYAYIYMYTLLLPPLLRARRGASSAPISTLQRLSGISSTNSSVCTPQVYKYYGCSQESSSIGGAF